MKKLFRAFLNLMLFALIFCVVMLALSYVLFRINTARNPFAPVILAPENTPVISSPQELGDHMRDDLAKAWVALLDRLILIPTGEVIEIPGNSSLHTTFIEGRSDISSDGQYLVYEWTRRIGGSRINILDLETKDVETLVQQEEFPDSTFFGGVSISPDNRNVVFAVFWENSADLVRFDLSRHNWQRLNIDVLISGFGQLDISSDGKIVVRCVRRVDSQVFLDECLLDENGRFLRYLTDERYFWIGYGKFTPNGEWVVYESRFKLYKVRVDGRNRQEIAPCSLGPLFVTNHYVVTKCRISEEPICTAIFVASLDGKEFWRLGYLEPMCDDE